MVLHKILLPLEVMGTNFPSAVIRQTAVLARHFQSEIVVLHVVMPLTYIAASDLLNELLHRNVESAREKLEKSLAPDLDGLTVKRLVLEGNPAIEILRTAQRENADIIVMPTHGYGTLTRFLLGSVTAKVLHNSECPVWTGAHLEDHPSESFAIRKVLCAVDFSSHSRKTVCWAHKIAAEFGAQLTLAHITPGVETYKRGGFREAENMLVSSADKLMATLQEQSGTDAAVLIDRGKVPELVNRAARKTNSDLLVVGRRSRGGRLGTNAYGIIRESCLPVLSV